MKSIYEENNCWSDICREIDDRFKESFRQLVEDYKDYNLIELESVVHSSLRGIVMREILERRIREDK